MNKFVEFEQIPVKSFYLILLLQGNNETRIENRKALQFNLLLRFILYLLCIYYSYHCLNSTQCFFFI